LAVAGAACANAMGQHNATARVTVKDLLAKFITGLPYRFNSISLAIFSGLRFRGRSRSTRQLEGKPGSRLLELFPAIA
jgi:hypothetical protein